MTKTKECRGKKKCLSFTVLVKGEFNTMKYSIYKRILLVMRV